MTYTTYSKFIENIFRCFTPLSLRVPSFTIILKAVIIEMLKLYDALSKRICSYILYLIVSSYIDIDNSYSIEAYLMKYDLECCFNIYLVLYYLLFFFSKNNIIKYLYYHHKSSTSVISYSYILKDKFTEPLIFLNVHEKYDKFILTYSSPTK